MNVKRNTLTFSLTRKQFSSEKGFSKQFLSPRQTFHPSDLLRGFTNFFFSHRRLALTTSLSDGKSKLTKPVSYKKKKNESRERRKLHIIDPHCLWFPSFFRAPICHRIVAGSTRIRKNYLLDFISSFCLSFFVQEVFFWKKREKILFVAFRRTNWVPSARMIQMFFISPSLEERAPLSPNLHPLEPPRMPFINLHFYIRVYNKNRYKKSSKTKKERYLISLVGRCANSVTRHHPDGGKLKDNHRAVNQSSFS